VGTNLSNDFLLCLKDVPSGYEFHRKMTTDFFQITEGNSLKHCFLEFLLQLLGKIGETSSLRVSSPASQTPYLHFASKIVELIHKVESDCLALLEYGRCQWDKKLQTSETEEYFEADGFSCLEEVRFPMNGLACYCLLVFVHGVDLQRMPTVLSPSYLLELLLPYAIALLKFPRASNYALTLLCYAVDRIDQDSISLVFSEGDNDFEILREDTTLIGTGLYLSFVQEMIQFIVSCPVQELRTLFFQGIRRLISLLDDKTRFHLLLRIVKTCPYPSIIALLLHICKEETGRTWSLSISNEIPPRRSLFAGDSLLKIIEAVETISDPLNQADLIMSILNFYRFLLIKDKCSNFTGIWCSKKQKNIRRTFLRPLEKQVDLLIEKLSKKASVTERDSVDQFMRSCGMEQMSIEQYEASRASSVTTLCLIKDTISRVMQLMNGAAPLQGIPDPHYSLASTNSNCPSSVENAMK